MLDGFRARYPMGDATVDVRPSPVEAVLAAARSDLLVIGRRHHLVPPGSQLGGPVSRALLRTVRRLSS